MTKNPLTRALFTLIGASLWLMACGGESETTPASGGEEGRRIEVTVHGSGYEPAEIRATAGERLTLVFTRNTDDGCGEELAIPAADIRRDLPLNEAVTVNVTAPANGRMRFTCGMDMYDGAIVVQ